jgi:hypothetical protein
MRGSGRACDLIAEWIKLAGQPDASGKHDQLCRSFLLENKMTPYPETDEKMALLHKKVSHFTQVMDTIAAYESLHFFDLFDIDADTTHHSKQSDSQTLLAVVLKSIFDSVYVEERVKLPLAIKFDDRDEVKKVLRQQGLETNQDKSKELSSDARPLIYAAFYDQDVVVRELIGAGFALQQLDQLILLELHQLGEQQTLKHGGPLEPPRRWVEERLKRQTKPNEPHPGRSWESRSWENELIQQQDELIQQEWTDMTQAQRLGVVKDDVRNVTWSKLPYLNGWSYRATGHIDLRADQQDSHEHSEIAAGDLFQQIHVSRRTSGVVEVTLAAVGKTKPITYVATQISGEEALELSRKMPQLARDDPKFWYKYTWLLLGEPGGGHVLLQQEQYDEVIQSLDLDERSRWDRQKLSDDLFRSTCTAFSSWVPIHAAKVGESWWDVEDLKVSTAGSSQPVSSPEQHDEGLAASSTGDMSAVEGPPMHSLASMPIFKSMKPAALREIRSAFRPKSFSADEKLFLEGDVPSETDDGLFVITAGTVAVLQQRTLSNGQAAETQVATLGAGKSFGETALMGGAQGARSATIAAVGEVQCFVLNKNEFDAFMKDVSKKGLLEQLNKQHGKNFARYDPFNAELDPMLRLYWAVVTGRHKLAEFFWFQSPHPFVGSFLCSYVCRRLGSNVSSHRDTDQKDDDFTNKWDRKANDLLAHLTLSNKNSVPSAFNILAIAILN